MDIQEPAYLAVEIHGASQNTPPEQRALPDFENPSGDSQAIGLHKPSYAHTVTDLRLEHPGIIRRGQYGEQPKF